MSNIDPFTQKLLQRTQARKEARLKRQLSSVLPENVTISCSGSSVKNIDCPRLPLAEKTNKLNCNSSENTKSSVKKRHSSEDLNSSLEKRLKSCNVQSPVPTHGNVAGADGIIQSSATNHVQEGAVVSTICTSPKQILQSGTESSVQSSVTSPVQVTVTSTVHEGSKKAVQFISPVVPQKESSLQARLGKLNQQYAEKFQVDWEEDQRRKEAVDIWELRNQEHKKKQEEEKARIIQEKIFGKDYSKQRVREQSKNLKLTDCGITPANSPQNIITKTEETKQRFPELEISCESQVKREEEINGKVADIGINQCENDDKETLKMQRRYDRELDKARTASVKDKKSIFEEKMKQESQARKKEMETIEWLRMKGSKTAGKKLNEVAKVEAPKIGMGKNEPEFLQQPASNFEPVNEFHNTDKESRTSEYISAINVCNTHSNKDLLVKDDLPVITEDLKSSLNSEGVDEDAPTTIGSRLSVNDEKPCDELLSTPVRHIKSLETDDYNEVYPLTPDTYPKTPSRYEDIRNNDCEKIQHRENSSKIDYADVNSPQPIDCTEDTIFSDTQAFDVSSILRAAQQEETVSSNLQMSSNSTGERGARCSTVKVDPAHLAMIPPLDLNVTPIVKEGECGEIPSAFTKALQSKANALKGPTQMEKLEIIDQKTKVTPSTSSKPPPKPPRANKKTDRKKVHTPKVGEDAVDIGEVNQGYDSKKDKHYSADCEDILKMVTTPEEKVSRKKMRRSTSFTEGQQHTPVKSGYHRELSEQYNACASFDKPVIFNSKKDQIQSLLEEAACQQNIVLQASQALNVAECSIDDKSNSPEVVEGERLLLLATERRTVCLEEVKALKESDFDPYIFSQDTIPPCKATLALTDFKLPLHPDFLTTLRNRKLEVGVFHFLVIVSAGNKNIFSTKAMSCYDEMECGSLLLKSNIVMKNIAHDFMLTVKVFGLHSGRNNDHITKVKKSNTNNQSPGNLKHLFSKRNKDEEYTYHASPQTVFRTSSFKLVGECKVNFSLLGNGVSKHVLTKVPSECPIEGCVQFRANIKPEFSAAVSGFLTILEDAGGYTLWSRRWCNMTDNKILYWRYPDDEKDKKPMGSIDLRYCIDRNIQLLARDICARPHTFELTLKRTSLPTDKVDLIRTIDGKVTRIKHWLCADNKEDRVAWMETINKQLSDSRAWRLKKISPKSPQPITQV